MAGKRQEALGSRRKSQGYKRMEELEGDVLVLYGSGMKRHEIASQLHTTDDMVTQVLESYDLNAYVGTGHLDHVARCERSRMASAAMRPLRIESRPAARAIYQPLAGRSGGYVGGTRGYGARAPW